MYEAALGYEAQVGEERQVFLARDAGVTHDPRKGFSRWSPLRQLLSVPYPTAPSGLREPERSCGLDSASLRPPRTPLRRLGALDPGC